MVNLSSTFYIITVMSDETEALLGHAKQDSLTRHSIWQECGLLLKRSAPVILAYTLQNSLQTLSVVIVGRTSPENLATAAFSYMWASVTAGVVALGGTTALDTLASAAFTGSQDPHELGVLLQRAFVVLTGLYVPISLVWILSEPIFLALGQDEQIARDSSRFLQCLLPGGLGYIYFEAMKRYLQAQGIMRAGTYVLSITAPLNVALNIMFVQSFGLLGAPFATSISYWLSFLLLVMYTRRDGFRCWGGWSRGCFNDLGTFIRLALLGYIQVATEWWAFEIVALAAGRLGKLPLAAQSVIMTSDQVMFTVPLGLGVVTSARVGNLLGSRDPMGARRTAYSSMLLGVILGALVLAILMATKNNFAKMFTDDEDVIKLTADILPVVALFQIADGLQASSGGILRGMGRQHIGAAVNLVGYYAGALPFGFYLAFYGGWGLQGLWLGNCTALYIVGTLEAFIVSLSNWDKQIENAFARMSREALEREEIRDVVPHSR